MNLKVMPMQKSSTQVNCQSNVDTLIKEPKAATLNFIKQFARAYQCSGSKLAAVVLN